MAESLKILGQADLASTTLTDVYTVPSGKSASLSKVFLSNRLATSAITIRLAVAVAGASNANKQYVEYDTVLDARQSIAISGITLGATDVLRAYASATGCSVNVLGSETDWTAPKVLGQGDITALTDLYTVPSGKSAVVSKLAIANRNATPALIRVAVAVAGASDNAKQYLVYDHPLDVNQALDLTAIALASTDVLRVYSNASGVSFNAFGVEE